MRLPSGENATDQAIDLCSAITPCITGQDIFNGEAIFASPRNLLANFVEIREFFGDNDSADR
jgi:hypothetical protein